MMEKGLNKVLLIGRTDGAPEVRQTAGGRTVAAFSLGSPRSWMDADGVQQEGTEWFNIVAWGPLAELCRDQLLEERNVYVEGRLHTRSWKDDLGRSHFRTEVVAQDMIIIG